MTPATARSVALEAIRRVIDDGAYSNRLLPSLLARSGLEPRDRAFATELALGTLRRRLPLDAAIERAASRPLDRVTPTEARHALRLGAYQLSSGVPPHAAVSATVDLVPGRAKGFVNAVLRRLAGATPEADTETGPEAIAARTGLRAWAVEELMRLVGPDAEVAAAALATKAPLSIRVVGGAEAVPEVRALLADAGVDASPGTIDPGCLSLVGGGDPRSLPGFTEGRWTVQDQASAFVVARARSSTGGTGLRRMRRAGRQVAARRRAGRARRGGHRGRHRPAAGRSDRRDGPAARTPAVARRPGRRGARGHGSVRPGPGRRPLQRPRVGPPAARAPVASAEGRARRARRPAAGDRLGRGRCDRRRGTARVRRLHVHPRRDRRGVRRPAPRPGRPPSG